MSILWILRAAGWMAEVGMPRAKGMFEVGTVGMVAAPEEGFWGATGSLGNLARAASISSLLIIAFVAALTCLGAIVPIIYLCTQSLPFPDRDKLLEQVGGGLLRGVCRFSTDWERVRGGESEDHTDSQHRLSRHPFCTRACKMHPDQKALELPWKVGRRPSRGQGPSHLGRASYLRDCCCCFW